MMRSVCLFRLCGTPWLMEPARKALVAAINAEGVSKMPAAALLWGAKRTVFKHFCAGETLLDCQELANSLSKANVRLIVDHSTEEMEDEASWLENLEAKKTLLQDLKTTLGDGAVFVPIKVTALASPQLLETMTTLLQQNEAWMRNSCNAQSIVSQLGGNEQRLYNSAMSNLRELCAQAQGTGIPLLFDAEQSHRQPAIDLISMELMAEFNAMGAAPVVYNTFQMYLRHSLVRVERDLSIAQQRNFVFAAKVVRGAYISSETDRAMALGLTESPIVPSKQDTDDQYNAATHMIIERIGQNAGVAATPAIVVATHNSASIEAAVQSMRDHAVPAAHPHVHMAQIMGMCDGLTLRTGLAGHNSLKLVLFGEFDQVKYLPPHTSPTLPPPILPHSPHDVPTHALAPLQSHSLISFCTISPTTKPLPPPPSVTLYSLVLPPCDFFCCPLRSLQIFPWLVRRMDENMDVFGGAQKELPLLELELRRRFGFA
jgi:proline dehydrogenase